MTPSLTTPPTATTTLETTPLTTSLITAPATTTPLRNEKGQWNICQNCGSLFSPRHDKKGFFCSRKCANQYHMQHPSEEWRKRLAIASASKKGKHYPRISEALRKYHLEHPTSEETLRKLAESHIGQKAWNKGVPITEEARRKNSEAHKSKARHKDYNSRAQRDIGSILFYIFFLPVAALSVWILFSVALIGLLVIGISVVVLESIFTVVRGNEFQKFENVESNPITRRIGFKLSSLVSILMWLVVGSMAYLALAIGQVLLYQYIAFGIIILIIVRLHALLWNLVM